MKNLVIKAMLLAVAVHAQVAYAQTRADGLAAMQLKDWDKAIKVYTGLLKADPADQNAVLTLTNAYLAKGDRARALEVAKSAINNKPEDPLVLIINAKVLQLEGKTLDAGKQFDRAAQKAKRISTPFARSASSLRTTPPGSKRPDLEKAVKLLQTAVDYNSDDLPSLMALGYAYKGTGQRRPRSLFLRTGGIPRSEKSPAETDACQGISYRLLF